MAGMTPEVGRRLLESKEHSDFEIDCQGEWFAVHKAIIFPQSRFVEKACSENRFSEGQDNILRLPEDRPDIVNLSIVYCYIGDYQYRLPQFVARNEIDIDPAINAEVEKARGEAHLHLCALADKLEIEPLKDLTAENFLKEAMTAKRTDWVVQSLGTLLKEMPLCADRSLTKVVMEKFLDNWDNVARDVQRYLEIVNPLACMYAERCIEAPMLRDLGGCP